MNCGLQPYALAVPIDTDSFFLANLATALPPLSYSESNVGSQACLQYLQLTVSSSLTSNLSLSLKTMLRCRLAFASVHTAVDGLLTLITASIGPAALLAAHLPYLWKL